MYKRGQAGIDTVGRRAEKVLDSVRAAAEFTHPDE